MFPPPPLFAFGWASPLMLYWLGAAAAPIVIHFLSRLNYREMPFAAMEYLLAAVRRQTRRLLFEQWLLLAIRTLLVVLVVLAVAETYIERVSMAFTPGSHVHRVLVFDGSYSMAYKPADKTRFDRAKELARQIVNDSPQGDAFTLVLMSSTPRVIVGTAALEPGAILQEIDNLELPHTIADLPAAIPAIQQLIENVAGDNPRLDRHEVYFLTDLQRTTWAPQLSEAARAQFVEQTDRLSQLASLFVIDLGQPSAANLAITDLRATDSLVTAGRDTPLRVRLRHFGPAAHDRQLVELFVDGRRVAQTEAELSPDGTGQADFFYRFDIAGGPCRRGPRRRRRAGRRQSSLSGAAGAAGDPRVVHRRPAVGRFVRRRGRLSRRGAGAAKRDIQPCAGASRGCRGERPVGAQPGELRLSVPLQRRPVHRQRGPRAGCLSASRRLRGVFPRRSGAGRPLQSRVGRRGGGDCPDFRLSKNGTVPFDAAGREQGRGAAHPARPLGRRHRPPAVSPRPARLSPSDPGGVSRPWAEQPAYHAGLQALPTDPARELARDNRAGAGQRRSAGDRAIGSPRAGRARRHVGRAVVDGDAALAELRSAGSGDRGLVCGRATRTAERPGGRDVRGSDARRLARRLRACNRPTAASGPCNSTRPATASP